MSQCITYRIYEEMFHHGFELEVTTRWTLLFSQSDEVLTNWYQNNNSIKFIIKAKIILKTNTLVLYAYNKYIFLYKRAISSVFGSFLL